MKKTTSKKKTATSNSLFKTGTGSSGDREARDWQDILGAETKAALDAKIGQTITGGMPSPVAALYWHSLLQERLRPCPTHLLRAVARSIADGTATLQEIVAERNTIAADVARGRDALQRSIVDGLREQTKLLLNEARLQTDEARRRMQAVDAMQLTDSESVWLTLRCQRGQNREGYPTCLSQADIAVAMGIHKQAVNRMERRLMKRPEVREYVEKHAEPRKPRGPHAKAVSNRGKVA